MLLPALLLCCEVFGVEPAAPAVQSVAVRGGSSPVNLATQVGRPYNARVIEDDVRRLWSTRRFEDIRVETTPVAGGIAVAFAVVPAPVLRLRAVRIEPSTFGLRMTLPEGSPIDRLRAHEIAKEARKQLQAQGYLGAKVDYELLPSAVHQADLRLTVRAGDPVRVKEIEFAGDPGLDPGELRGALRALRIRRLLPRWRLLPNYSPEAVESDLARLRSLYLAKGYFDASVREEGTQIRGRDAAVRIAVQSGPLYPIRGGPPGSLCGCLLAARRAAEREGILDFSARLKVQGTELKAGIERGQPYRVGRIEFLGNRHYKDATLRRNFLLEEGDVLDEHLLRRSLARLNRSMLFEPADAGQVLLHPDEKSGVADVTVRLTERKRGAWSLSGPVGPMSLAGPLQASLRARLPFWPAYAASVSLLAFAHPLLPFLPLGAKGLVWPVLGLERPFSPGEGWKSGFAVTPRFEWRLPALRYATTQLEQRLLPRLAGECDLVPELPVMVESPAGEGTMYCDPPKPRLTPARQAAALTLRLLGSLPVF